MKKTATKTKPAKASSTKKTKKAKAATSTKAKKAPNAVTTATSSPFWMLKSEPETYAYDQLVKDNVTSWTGVRNYTARIHLNAMKNGDRCFFYHSGGPKEVVAVAEVVREAYPDATATGEDADKGWVTVDIKPVTKLNKAITLADLKKHKTLSQMKLVTMSRLSVSPVTEAEAKELFELSGTEPP